MIISDAKHPESPSKIRGARASQADGGGLHRDLLARAPIGRDLERPEDGKVDGGGSDKVDGEASDKVERRDWDPDDMDAIRDAPGSCAISSISRSLTGGPVIWMELKVRGSRGNQDGSAGHPV